MPGPLTRFRRSWESGGEEGEAGRSQRRAAAGQRVPWQRDPGGEEEGVSLGLGESSVVQALTWAFQPRGTNSPVPTPPEAFGCPRQRSRSFIQVPGPPRQDTAPAARSATPSPGVVGVPGSHLGAGAGPAHHPEQQEREAQRAGGAGHGGEFRTGPSLPPAEPRAATDSGRVAGGGGGAGEGPPCPREGPGRVPVLPSLPLETPGPSPPHPLAGPGPGDSGHCAPGERGLG